MHIGIKNVQYFSTLSVVILSRNKPKNHYLRFKTVFSVHFIDIFGGLPLFRVDSYFGRRYESAGLADFFDKFRCLINVFPILSLDKIC